MFLWFLALSLCILLKPMLDNEKEDFTGVVGNGSLDLIVELSRIRVEIRVSEQARLHRGLLQMF